MHLPRPARTQGAPARPRRRPAGRHGHQEPVRRREDDAAEGDRGGGGLDTALVPAHQCGHFRGGCGGPSSQPRVHRARGPQRREACYGSRGRRDRGAAGCADAQEQQRGARLPPAPARQRGRPQVAPEAPRRRQPRHRGRHRQRHVPLPRRRAHPDLCVPRSGACVAGRPRGEGGAARQRRHEGRRGGHAHALALARAARVWERRLAQPLRGGGAR
mmetsp:Transcript_25874/g.63847  ORF Transcript_25874/g.63847 Transcript_25874/m.63847 type:complete len:216 (+) Transcript_25874:609-1256(+)